jgi:hypothetical protein
MATRTSTRSTKAVKFVDSAGSDDEDVQKSSSLPTKTEVKKSRGRPPNSRRNRTNDDEDWDAGNEHIEEEEDDDVDDDTSENGRDVTKKFQVNRPVNSVYDFG